MFYINNKIIQFKNHVIKSVINNANPLNLPPNTIRVKFASGYTPTMGDTQTLVDANENIWDIYKQSNNWTRLFNINGNNVFNELLEVLGANTSNVTKMTGLFRHCESLASVPLFDTSNVTDMASIFAWCKLLTTVPLFDTSNVTIMESTLFECSSLTSVPLFNTSNVTNIRYMCCNCRKVQSGALALYQQASTQANPPIIHDHTFTNCGVNTQTGAAELAQIPNDWK